MRISDWTSDVCSSDLPDAAPRRASPGRNGRARGSAAHSRDRPLRTAGIPDARQRKRHARRAASPGSPPHARTAPWIGSAPWRERVCPYVYISVVAVTLKHKKNKKNENQQRKTE